MSADSYDYVAYRKLPPVTYENRFLKTLKPAVCVIHCFGKSYLYNSSSAKIFSKLLVFILFIFTIVIFVFGAFGRNTIDTWTQLSLYVIPLLSIPCGTLIFASDSYNEVLLRDVTTSTRVRFFVSPKSELDKIENTKPSAHNKRWLHFIAIKSLLNPFALELIQWGGFFCFSIIHEDNYGAMIGTVTAFSDDDNDLDDIISQKTWIALYIGYWSLSMYLIGFLMYQFVFISRLIVRDTVSLMSLFGRSPFLKSKPTYKYGQKQNFLIRMIKRILNFLSFDLISSLQDEDTFNNSAQLIRQCDGEDVENFGRRHVDEDKGQPRALSPFLYSEKDIVNEISANDAACLFSKFIAEVEGLTSVFMPFTMMLSFFGVANLITHVGIFVYKPKSNPHLDLWTLYRTIIFLAVALRMLLCVRHVSLILGKLPPHLKFLQCSGKLMKNRANYDDWNLFFELLVSFNLGKRSFGFPLTLRQVASIATFLNMALLIVLSICKSSNGS